MFESGEFSSYMETGRIKAYENLFKHWDENVWTNFFSQDNDTSFFLSNFSPSARR